MKAIAMRCDCHVHIVGPSERFPQVAERTYLAGLAPLERLVDLGQSRGIDRFVIVQPSFYGEDNTALLDALRALRGKGRGVAVIGTQTVSDQELARLDEHGVRGLRVNLYSPLAGKILAPMDRLFADTAAVAFKMTWHVEVIAPLADLLRNADLLGRSPVPVVIDHYGLYGRSRPASPEGRGLIELLAMPHLWVKLSAPYRHDKGPLNIEPDPEWVCALLDAAPDRCLWGSDWPHPPAHDTHKGASVATPYRPLSYQDLVDRFAAAVGSRTRLDAVFGANAARLYGF